MLTILLLFCSNTFMTIAWYGHLRFRDRPLMLVIVVSWLIAFAEYCFQVPANRIGYGEFSGYQLKIIQEAITLIVFAVFAYFYLREARRVGTTFCRSCVLWVRLCSPSGRGCKLRAGSAAARLREPLKIFRVFGRL
jgi:uncharacterized protein (DUF486 family)